MIFLIEYNRKKGEIVTLKPYSASHREDAESDRLKIELTLIRNKAAHEVVLLEANSEDHLRETHRRYFENIAEIAST